MLADHLVLPNILADRASREPGRPFLTEAGGAGASYGEVNDRANRWAAAAARWGLEDGAAVATMTPATIEWFAAWIGLARAGLLEASISTDFQGEMLIHALNRSRAQVLLIGGDQLKLVTDDVIARSTVKRIVILDDALPEGAGKAAVDLTTADAALRHVAPAPARTVCPWEPAALIHTSGTTGPSKYVITPWGLLYSGALTMGPPHMVGEDDISYQPLPTSHISLRCSVYAMALAGGRVVFRRRFSLGRFWTDVAAHGCTNATVAAFAKLLMDQPPTADDRTSSLKTVVALPGQSAAFCERFGVRAYGGYGMTEIGIPIVADFERRPRAVGKIREGFPGLEVRIVDDHDEEVPVGERGELIVRSSEPWSLFAGYFEDAEATASAWKNGWFHTGDIFRRDEGGFLYYVDRRKDSIRRRNQNISSFEVEELILGHPHVRECAAVAVPADGEEEEVLVAVVVDDGFSMESLHAFAVATMPRYMVPRYVRVLDALPRTQAMERTRKVVLRQQGVTHDTWTAPRLTRMT